MGLFGDKNKQRGTSAESSRQAATQQVQTSVPAPVTTAEQYRSLFLLCANSATFKGHWALFAPHDKRCKAGRKIHAAGSVAEGFQHEIVRNYNLTRTRSGSRPPIEIGVVSRRYLVEIAEDSQYAKEAVARDAFEQLVLSVPAPGPSLNKVSGQSSAARSGPPRRVTISDCQWWVTRVVEKLVEHGYLLPPTRGLNKGKSPLEILAAAPKH
ncbi:hypothetical protein F4778DRAFT_483472 [Xylariomycetidae sp. FL2044]|nr:hypothetical protein F4778DRAFT_483472 [Xylariomycetidae sp. FL2044]